MKNLSEFKRILTLDLECEFSLFWMEQYYLWIKGIRDVRIHANTFYIMSGN